ncbi:laccase domain-containing protein [Fluviispira multicolorata]|uniref:Uncharacterized protein n=1 Tax=Fluviispira multicolorata TaxID=2654512 RepID=A0A833N5Z2_9BACT|nr:laccase domain-containing protein [Fluviispira multicolorata]KAB8029079.1 hypothetical protein GCL57_11100 [Fluviispira multicolorata]
MRILVSLNLKEYPTFIPKSFEERFLLNTVVLKDSPFSKDFIKEIPISGLYCSVAFTLNEPLENTFFVKACHGNQVVRACEDGSSLSADAHYISIPISTKQSPQQCKKNLGIRTADCLAVAICFENDKYFIGSLSHAGWKGLSSGILQNTLDKIKQEALQVGVKEAEFVQNLHVHIAPAIFGVSYECGSDVHDALLKHRENLFSQYQQATFYNSIYSDLININQDKILSGIIEKGNQKKIADNKIFPDLQLLAALECIISGISEQNIEILRENTYSHPVLFSFREATHKKTDKNLRQWTHLRFPFVDQNL